MEHDVALVVADPPDVFAGHRVRKQRQQRHRSEQRVAGRQASGRTRRSGSRARTPAARTRSRPPAGPRRSAPPRSGGARTAPAGTSGPGGWFAPDSEQGDGLPGQDPVPRRRVAARRLRLDPDPPAGGPRDPPSELASAREVRCTRELTERGPAPSRRGGSRAGSGRPETRRARPRPSRVVAANTTSCWSVASLSPDGDAELVNPLATLSRQAPAVQARDELSSRNDFIAPDALPMYVGHPKISASAPARVSQSTSGTSIRRTSTPGTARAPSTTASARARVAPLSEWTTTTTRTSRAISRTAGGSTRSGPPPSAPGRARPPARSSGARCRTW